MNGAGGKRLPRPVMGPAQRVERLPGQETSDMDNQFGGQTMPTRVGFDIRFGFAVGCNIGSNRTVGRR
ncbi:hypothetical protein [Cupriavidus sp. HPC(L)]|uniref:hypothetical protein n=1 Tax=Cupriavidus sp. HPC(L) TaxID=1217418 RepID=UPI0012ECE7D2|nr:hypothetical protein [Cupriavidus sp. HPC(L)]